MSDGGRELSAIGHAEFRHDLGDVVFDGAHANPQHVADLLIGQALRQEVPDLFLTWGQVAHGLPPTPASSPLPSRVVPVRGTQDRIRNITAPNGLAPRSVEHSTKPHAGDDGDPVSPCRPVGQDNDPVLTGISRRRPHLDGQLVPIGKGELRGKPRSGLDRLLGRRGPHHRAVEDTVRAGVPMDAAVSVDVHGVESAEARSRFSKEADVTTIRQQAAPADPYTCAQANEASTVGGRHIELIVDHRSLEPARPPIQRPIAQIGHRVLVPEDDCDKKGGIGGPADKGLADHERWGRNR